MKRSVFFLFSLLPLFSIAQPPAGYYNTATGTCATLKTALRNIINNGVSPQSYASLWTQYQASDIKPREVAVTPAQQSLGVVTSANVIWDVYSDNPSGTDSYNLTPGTVASGGQQDDGTLGTSEGQRYNREHSIPLSWFNGSTGTNGPATDYNHIFPTDKKVNGERANYPYGEVASATFTSLNGSKLGTSSVAGLTGTVFEPINEYKGDVARAFLYFVTMYQDNMSTWASNSEATQAFEPNTFPSVDVPFLKLMLKWHNQDPVSQKEIDRNNAAYSYQVNRNPYIDHPEYVGQVWNASCPGLSALPVELLFFTGRLNGNLIQLNWEVGTEANLNKYEVERSFNGNEYSKIGEVKAANQSNYSYNDNADNIRGRRVYYRLKKIDKDGKFGYSEIFSVHIPLNTKFSVYPNPAKEFIRLQVNINSTQQGLLTITDITGKAVLKQNVQLSQGSVIVPLISLSNGSYFLKIRIGEEVFTQRILVAK
jgi:endonuclease I